jgi:hypothetical protein
MHFIVRNTLLMVGAALLAQVAAFAADTSPIRSAKEVKWGAPPPVFPSGAKFAVIAGAAGISNRTVMRPVAQPSRESLPLRCSCETGAAMVSRDTCRDRP